MPGHDIITIGGSAGGVESLGQVASRLPRDLPASVFVAIHVSPNGSSILPQILNRNGPLPASHAVDGEAIEPGRIYVAPPNRHLLVDDGAVRLSIGPRENGVRPAVDPLFRTASRWYGPRVVGVVLSGTLDDGAAGLLAIKERGGLAVVQDPGDALFPGMPRSALDAVTADHVAAALAIPAILARLAVEEAADPASFPMPGDILAESRIAAFDIDAICREDRAGVPSGFACPDCAGVLWELKEGELVRFRCRVGHAYSLSTLMDHQSRELETALWMALRTLEERAALSARMAERFQAKGHDRSAARFVAQAKEARSRSALIRDLLVKAQGDPEAEPRADDPPARPGGEAG